VLRLNSIPSEGVLLDKGWKFRLGDNPDYARPDYDDREWQSIDPTLDIHDSLPQIPKSGIGWFRLYLSIDSTIQQNQLALVLQQSGASEIFLNGVLIYRFGVVRENPREVKAYDPLRRPVLFPVNENDPQLLAVRYALEPGVLYTTMFETANPALWIKIKNLNTAIDYHERDISTFLTFSVFIIGVFVLAIILHLAFYVFYPQQKANLSFTFFALFFMAQNIIRIWGFLNGNEVSFKFYLANFCFALLLVSDLFLLTAIHQLSDQKKDKTYLAFIILVIISVLFIIPQYGWGWILGGALVDILIKLNIMRIAFRSVKRKKRGAWIIAWGAICCLVFFVFFLVDGIFPGDLLGLGTFRLVLYVISVLSIPVATSIYLGLDFAFINHTLKKKLVEVEELSQKAISQEKEKQEILSSQKETLEEQVQQRTAALNQSLEDLKSTQAQLIQSEKMASLGELTAGIAHEIQNPLNFVNNFSEVNKELLMEMKGEIDQGNLDEAKAIANDVIKNQDKINHHGKRADAIVRGMLQHSRSSAVAKELTNINNLADEYLRLAYHGLKAKDNSFKATIKTDFDTSIVNINVIPQDIGRVLLNLYNNGFYAISERRKKREHGYEPTISITTKKVDDKVKISVQDNGCGIDEKVFNKIFQPFFTTKPAGKGTGLGLSLSYDIIKAHGGEIKVETQEDEYTKFIIILPFAV
jgi:signal transduction histidine kinase